MSKMVHPLRTYRRNVRPKLSLDSFAKSIGRSKATLSRIENWKQRVPQELLPKLSEITGIAPSDLRPDLAQLLNVKEPE